MELIDNHRRPTRKRAWRAIAILVLAAALAGGGAYYWKTRPAPQQATRQVPAIPVTVVESSMLPPASSMSEPKARAIAT